MCANKNLSDNESDVNVNFEQDMKMQQLKKELAEKFGEYKKTLSYLAADAPIQALCLPASLENILLDHGLLRIYDLFNRDFTEIKGLGVARIRHLTTRLDQFFAMM